MPSSPPRFGFGLAAASLQARPVPQNLAGGLGALVESNIAIKDGQANAANFNGFATQQAADYASLAIQDAETGRFLVDIHPTQQSCERGEARAAAPETLPVLHPHRAGYEISRSRRGRRLHLAR